MRASRLLAILILLQNRGRLTAERLAAEFEVSVRTVYRDIDALSAAGVPVYGDPGPGGGFALLDGYRTRLTGMAGDEAEALALAGIPEAADAVGLGGALASAFGKLLAAMPEAGGKRGQAAAARFHIDPADWYRAGEPVPHLPALARAVLDQRRVAVRYASWTQRRDWTLDPLGLVLKGGEWYLAARGKGREGTYRVAGIERLAVLDELFVPPAHFDLPTWWRAAQQRFEADLFAAKARMRASPLGCERLLRLSPRGRAAVAAAEEADDAGWRLLEMAVENSDHGARELLSLGAEFEVLEPADLRDRIAALALAAAKRHAG
jgi:predicted DNA-binding transcriptional regulator YafY